MRAVAGDVLDADDVAKAVVGQDAVVVTLGIPDNPFKVRLTRRASSPLRRAVRGTANVIAAMRTGRTAARGAVDVRDRRHLRPAAARR